MVSNAGHADLLQNFVCASKARNHSLENLVVFCTDVYAQQRAEAIGLTTIFNPLLFGELPTKEAEAFADETFQKVVYAKMVAAHLVSIMGYSFLFQDADVVWYEENPLHFFQRSQLIEKYDMLFQDDGGRTLNYAPFFANSGFYFAKNNEKTRFFFQQVLYRADKMRLWGVDQGVFNAVLPEVSSFVGMSIKILSFDEFPGGRTFQDPFFYDFMREFLTGSRTAIAYHMHWTNNKDQKILQMKQIGMWFMQKQNNQYECSSEHIIECFYWNRPSDPLCQASANMTKDGDGSFPYEKKFWDIEKDYEESSSSL